VACQGCIFNCHYIVDFTEMQNGFHEIHVIEMVHFQVAFVSLNYLFVSQDDKFNSCRLHMHSGFCKNQDKDNKQAPYIK
jgi:hypothetical protein